MSLISIENVSAGYKNANVIDNVSFEINEGELVGILGANGSGKSTLAKAVCNILPHSGKVMVDGNVIEELKVSDVAKIIGYIPQKSGISIDISVLDVVMMGYNSRLKILENPSRDMKEKAEKVIELLGMADKKNANFMLLSEGQKQLIILARALVNEGTLLVLDEPESALDFSVRYRTMAAVRKWINAGKRAGLVILHDTMLALNNCDKLILINDKKIADIIDLHDDSVEVIEGKLAKIYENICLVKNTSKKGRESLIMVNDAEEV